MFKKGDKVICIDAANSPFVVGEEYTVAATQGKYVYVLEGDPECAYFQERFKLNEKLDKEAEMISEGFGKEYTWIPNQGVMPVAHGVDVDLVTSNNTYYGENASHWSWDLSGGVTHWRLHVPSKLQQPTRPAPPMPAIKPPKQEDVFVEVPEIDPASQSRVVQAFNRMTGHNITDDNLNTLKVLVELFGSDNGTN